MDLAQFPAERLENALGVDLMMRHGKAAYLVTRADGESLLNATDGSPIVIDKTDAENLAKQDFKGDGEVASIEHGMAPDRETRRRQGAFLESQVFGQGQHSHLRIRINRGNT